MFQCESSWVILVETSSSGYHGDRPPPKVRDRNIGYTSSRKLGKWEELQRNVVTASWTTGGGQEAAGDATGPFSPILTHLLWNSHPQAASLRTYGGRRDGLNVESCFN